MKTWKTIILIAMTMLLLATAVVPALADDEVPLTIRNKTETTIKLILRGPSDEDLTISKVNTVVRLEPGVYTYRYVACGRTQRGTFTLTAPSGSLTLKKCEKGVNGSIVIDNRTGASFLLRLSGPKTYALTIKPGENKLTLVAGRFQYSALVCGATETGSHAVKSGAKNADWVWSCD